MAVVPAEAACAVGYALPNARANQSSILAITGPPTRGSARVCPRADPVRAAQAGNSGVRATVLCSSPSLALRARVPALAYSIERESEVSCPIHRPSVDGAIGSSSLRSVGGAPLGTASY